MNNNEKETSFFRFGKISDIFLNENRYLKIPLAALLALALYVAYWAIISIINFDEANANVYDLGLAYISIWSVTHLSFASHALLIDI